MRKSLQLAVLTVSALGLSSCASFAGGKHDRLSSAEKVDVESIVHDYAVEQLEIGRRLMRAGAFASAIDPLRKASQDREIAPTAYNAIGVAYTQLDRKDVAARFFQLAVLLDPENKAFAANLVRLKAHAGDDAGASRQLAATNEDRSDPKSAPKEAPSLALGSRVTIETPQARVVNSAYGKPVSATSGSGTLKRVSAYEVRLGGPRHAPRGQRRKVASAGYPIRIKIGQSGKADKASPSDAKTYPQRVEF